MHWRKIAGIVLLGLGLSGSAVAASLPDAAEQRDKASVRTLLQTGVDVNAAQVDGTTALHWAAYHDDPEMAGVLVRADANVSAVNRYGASALAEACRNGNAAIVKLLLEAGADANTTMKGGETVLMLAAHSGNAETVKALLAHGADPNQRERLDQTALMWAAAEGHAAVVRALIEAGADLNARLDSGFTPFFFAVREGRPDVVQAFIEAGIDVNAMMQHVESRGSRRTAKAMCPLLVAVQNGHFELAIALIEAGADPLLPNFNNTTPLMAAAGVGTTSPDEEAGEESEALDAVKMLLDLGADINTVDNNGDTAMHGAAYNAYPLVPHLLAERGADPQIWKSSNKAGGTPLFIAEGYADRTVQPDARTIEAITKLMLAAGISTEGERPKIVDVYERP